MKSKEVKQDKGKFSVANKYPPFHEWDWRCYDGTRIVDPDEFIKQYKEREFFIGTDSQVYSKRTVYTTVLIAYERGRGGLILVHSDKTETPPSLRQRLLMEAMRSLEAAFFVNQRVPSQSSIAVHLDVNSNLKWKSGQYKDELVGMIAAQGFNCTCKPNSWAASSAADRKT
jgi:hypothetical protein